MPGLFATIFVLVSLVSSCAVLFKPDTPSIAISSVFIAGEDGYKIFRVPAIVKAANGDLLAFAEGRAGGDLSEPVHSIQIQQGNYAGRLIIPANHRLGKGGSDKGPTGAQVIFSDNHGINWQLGAVDDSYGDGLNPSETTVVELADGRLLFNTRDQHGAASGTRGDVFSNDGGANFSTPAESPYRYFQPSSEVLDPPVVQGTLLRAASLFCRPISN